MAPAVPANYVQNYTEDAPLISPTGKLFDFISKSQEHLNFERFLHGLSPTRCPQTIPFGKSITIEWMGSTPVDQVTIKGVPSSFRIGKAQVAAVDSSWKEIVKKNSAFFDGDLVRFEGIGNHGGGSHSLEILGSDINYRFHGVLRKGGVTGFNPKSRYEYPNPFTVCVIQVTTDGYILIGQKNGRVSDQIDLAFVGAGFIDNREKTGKGFTPRSVKEQMVEECRAETSYGRPIEKVADLDAARAIAVINGCNRDTTVAVVLPLNVPLREIQLNDKHGKEFLKIVPVKASVSEIFKVINRKQILGGEERNMCSDHVIGSLVSYAAAIEKGIISDKSHLNN